MNRIRKSDIIFFLLFLVLTIGCFIRLLFMVLGG